MATVLVTGAAGMLGAACISAMDPVDRVIALVRDRDGRSRLYAERLIDRCVEVRSELADMERLLAEYQPERVLHLGAQTQVPIANASPLSTFESNVRGTYLLLEACRLAAKPPSAILVASSDKAYGAAPLPYTESQPLQANSPYDVSKACTDMIARSYASHFGLPVVVTRCANLYGPGDWHTERLVPHCCARLRAGRPPILRSTGQMSREWLYVEDAARATLMLLKAAPDLAGEAVNVGGGQVATVAQVAALLVEISGGPAARVAETEPRGEIAHQSLDTSRIAALGWRAQVGLQQGLERTWEWWGQSLGGS